MRCKTLKSLACRAHRSTTGKPQFTPILRYAQWPRHSSSANTSSTGSTESTSPLQSMGLPLDPDGRAPSIGIVGGGISGLATAFMLSQPWLHSGQDMARIKPDITIYEADERLGGWLATEKVGVGDDYVRVERGPRTLATGGNSVTTMMMLEELGILDSVRWVKKDSVGARNRYIYPGEGEGLYRVPTELAELVSDAFTTDGKTASAVDHILRNLLSRKEAPSISNDPGLGKYMEQFIGKQAVEFFLSAFVHGIYAGDVWNLSAFSKGPWKTLVDRQQGMPSTFLGTLMSQGNQRVEAITKWAIEGSKSHEWYEDWRNSFVFYFKEGIQILPLALESWLRMQKVKPTNIVTNAAVKKIKKTESDKIEVSGLHNNKEFTNSHDYVVTAIPPHALTSIIDPTPPWTNAFAHSIGTVTLFYDNAAPIKYQGFGYIIPTMLENNPHGALGVIFDSATRPAQDTARGQKVTVLLGGKYWQPGIDNKMALPSTEELEQQALETLELQLGVTARPTVVRSALLRDCIPQPTIGFMRSINPLTNPEWSAWAQHWDYRLWCTGPPVTGPGVHDSIVGAQTLLYPILLDVSLRMAAAKQQRTQAAGEELEVETKALRWLQSQGGQIWPFNPVGHAAEFLAKFRGLGGK